MTEVGSISRHGREYYFPVGTPLPYEGDWKRVDCTKGIEILKANTDPRAREAVLARKRKKKQ